MVGVPTVLAGLRVSSCIGGSRESSPDLPVDFIIKSCWEEDHSSMRCFLFDFLEAALLVDS